VVLTGIETGSWGADLDGDHTLGGLISEIGRACPDIRIRLGSMAPELLTRSFIDTVSREECMVPHFHISMQSASDKILRLMKRRYSLKMALDNIDYAREKMPRLMLTADLMVGFPGEGEEDFRLTLDFVSRVKLLSAHVFAYSKRAGTPAADFAGQIPDAVKHERSRALIEECRRVRDEVLSEVISSGKPLSVIFETRRSDGYIGHSDSYIEVVADSKRDIRGEICSVIPILQKDGVIYGKIADFNN
jgi:threonylcarbamoyladenosine tRNA methylthiotransferase MtaB